ncbi:MAG: hypothetical protein NTY22_06235 [Proteobacteria bacterium]|nr:hypothetical protein [Pseudomonadota bacterium]
MILKNIEALTKSGWPGDLLIRMPLIPGFNDDDENIKSTTQFLKKCGLSKIEILPFHRLGESKYDKLGLNYFYADKPAPKKIEIKSVKKLFDSYGIACVELS